LLIVQVIIRGVLMSDQVMHVLLDGVRFEL